MDRFDSFMHYGFDRKTYDACRSDIVEHNLRSAKSLSRVFFVAMAMFLLLSVIGVNSRFLVVYAIETIGFALVTLIIDTRKEATRHSTLIVVLVSIALLAFGIVSSAADVTVVATSFHVVMIVIAIFFVATMPTMAAIFGIGVVGLAVDSYLFKPAALAIGDTYNAVIFLVVALALHFITCRDRIQSYVNLHELQAARRELAIESHFDGLSGLFNRTHFFEVTEALDMSGDFTVCLVDIDDFKKVNDQYGHHTGDLVIAGLGAAIRTALGLAGKAGSDAATAPAKGRQTFAGRLGGDEFIMLVGPDGPDAHEAGRRVQEIMASTDFGELHGIGVSIGYASTAEYPGVRVNRLYRAADVKMYLEKTKHHIGR